MASEMVMIACKHPNGVVLNLDRYEVTNKTSNSIQRVNGKATVTLAGWSHRQNQPDPTEGLGGYAFTPVPLDFWQEWVKQHPDFPMIVDKIIVGPHKDPVTQARDHADIPKMFAPTDGVVKGITPLKTND